MTARSRWSALTELALSRAGSTAAGPQVLTGFIDQLESAGLDRAVAHVAWHAVLTTVVGSLRQQQDHHLGEEPTFDAVLDIMIGGVMTAADEPASATAQALLEAHALAR